MVHLYYGDGKGKTTAACGLAIRAAGSGMHVLFSQFFKDGMSSEIKVLSDVDGVTVMTPNVFYGRYKNMNDSQRKECCDCYSMMLNEIINCSGNYEMIVLDESVSVCYYGLFDRKRLVDFLKTEGKTREIVLTGRNPEPELFELSDYATEMRKEKHPFDSGLWARKGIEY